MTIDFFIDPFLETEIEGVGTIKGEFPLRNFDVIKFYKEIKEKYNVISISIDVEENIISIQVGDKKK
ncbi:MAG: hypothetical protein ACW99F_03765 [Candidatus Hodarchaeales archaeon]|jgi:hypothetical protein